jgi:hypothetical protein
MEQIKVTFHTLTTATTKIILFWNVKPFTRLWIYQGAKKKLLFPSALFISNLLNPCNVAASYFETSANIYSDDAAHKKRLRNKSDLKSFKLIELFPSMPRRESRSTSPFILNLSTRWTSAVNITPRPLYPRGRTPVSVNYKAGWALETVWALALAGIWTPVRPVRGSVTIPTTVRLRLESIMRIMRTKYVSLGAWGSVLVKALRY